jgi:ABC-2 type transport system ATP-binding protein
VTAAISIQGVSKRFRIGSERYDSLKDRVLHIGRAGHEDFWALRDIDLEIEQGETFGLLGHNGSGKSTLLKCIAGILQPTNGTIRTTGKMSALLELGAGFHPDLTGRENVELNGLLLGLSRREIARRFDTIVEFAGPEVATAIDRQVKFYSSGMFVRLGFAVAVSVDPQVLLVDEVLAVGDEAFQRKCLARVKHLQREGCTIVVVTHAADVVRQICDRAAVLDHGDLLVVGKPPEAIRRFREHLFATGRSVDDLLDDHAAEQDASEEEADAPAEDAALVPPSRRRTLKVRVRGVEVRHPGQPDRPYIVTGDPLEVRITLESSEPTPGVNLGLGIRDVEGKLVWTTNTELLGVDTGPIDGEATISWQFASVPLLDGQYSLNIGVVAHDDESVVLDWIDEMPGFEVMSASKVFGVVALDTTVRRVEGAPEGHVVGATPT